MAIYFGGSRSLPVQAVPLVHAVVGSVLASGQSVHVGCSAGADQAVIQSALCSGLFPQVRVWAVFSQSGAGSWAGSAVQAVQSFAARGGFVSWLAGGELRVPLAGRLIQRSIAGLRVCSAAVFFSPGSGSLAVAAHAVAAGIPVFAFGDLPAPVPGCAGQWLKSAPGALPGWPFSCWSWQPAQLSLF